MIEMIIGFLLNIHTAPSEEAKKNSIHEEMGACELPCILQLIALKIKAGKYQLRDATRVGFLRQLVEYR
jgi:hypothetical protein